MPTILFATNTDLSLLIKPGKVYDSKPVFFALICTSSTWTVQNEGLEIKENETIHDDGMDKRLFHDHAK